uniref:Arrestin-like N-terminal domain-containing protein n=1 Tax=Seriola lalandi dorsalis TaxID=1841481 RepID=A0A3B4WPQ6_SERLL
MNELWTVKINFKVTYNSINGKDIFTNGDWVTGQVTLEVAKDCQINHLFIKFKGKAEMNWTERQGYGTVVYHSKQKYFSLKHYFIRDKTLTGRRDFIFEWKDQISHNHHASLSGSCCGTTTCCYYCRRCCCCRLF